jgi:hypothetical protein
MNVTALDDHVSQVDTDTEAEFRSVLYAGFMRRDVSLPSDRTSDGVNDAGEFNQKSVAHELYNAAMVSIDQGLEDLLAQHGESVERSGIVTRHQSRVPNHIGSQYRGKASFQNRPPSTRRLPTMDKRIYGVG